jgi:hypothetical protein
VIFVEAVRKTRHRDGTQGRLHATFYLGSCGILLNAEVYMRNSMKCSGFVLVTLFSLSVTALSQVNVIVDRNTFEASSTFKFQHVPSPVKNNAASGAKLKLIVGRSDGNSLGLKALTDGVLPSGEDQPDANFFFSDGSDGGRFLLDLDRSIDIVQVNTYSWHPDTRGPQVYNLFASDGKDEKFNPEPDANTDPATCGWKLIATVDTRSGGDDDGGQYGVSIRDASGSLGKFRYLLFDSVPTETDDDFGNTFFSEINVIAAKPN